MGRFGSLEVYIIDPYVMALGKIDRGFESDLDGIVFLIQQKWVSLEKLETVVATALEQWQEFNLNSVAMRTMLQTLRKKTQ